MAQVIIYTTGTCPYCAKAKALLQAKNCHFIEHRVDLNPSLRTEMEKISNRHTVPQILINGQTIGGCDELYALEKQDQLTLLLEG